MFSFHFVDRWLRRRVIGLPEEEAPGRGGEAEAVLREPRQVLHRDQLEILDLLLVNYFPKLYCFG